MKKSILLLTIALLLTACNFTIFGENDDEVILEKRNITIVERNITLEELSGKWVLEEESIERYLKLNTKYLDKNKLNTLKESLKLNYIYIYNDGTSKFRMNYYEEEKEYKGKIYLGYIPTLWRSNITIDDYYLRIMYQVKDSYGVKYSEGRKLYFLKLNNKFYLGEKFTRGDIDAGNERTYYLLYKKVKEVNNESN